MGTSLDELTLEWTDGIEVQDGEFVMRRFAGAISKPKFTALFSRHSIAHLPRVNWHPAWSVFRRLKPFQKVISLKPNSLKPFDETDRFPVSFGASMRLFEFTAHGQRFVVDSFSLIQRIICSRSEIFGTLLSPFRDVAIKAARVGDVVNVVVNHLALARAGYFATPYILSNAELTAVAYWLTDAKRMVELARCNASIVQRTNLYVPSFDFPMTCNVRGLTDGNFIFVQSLVPGLRNPRHDAFWLDTWSAIRVCRATGAHCQELYKTDVFTRRRAGREFSPTRRLERRLLDVPDSMEIRKAVDFSL